jgi:hypothetical protein
MLLLRALLIGLMVVLFVLESATLSVDADFRWLLPPSKLLASLRKTTAAAVALPHSQKACAASLHLPHEQILPPILMLGVG